MESKQTNACAVATFLTWKVKQLNDRLDAGKYESVGLAPLALPRDAEIIHSCIRTKLREQ